VTVDLTGVNVATPPELRHPKDLQVVLPSRIRGFALAVGILAASPLSVFASPATDALGKCLVGETTGNDRVLLVRWMTFAFAAHPAVHDAVTVDASKADALNREVAHLFTELITQRCAELTKAVVKEGGDPGAAFSAAFEVLGRAASVEVMRSPEVNASVAGFTDYLDQAAFDKLMKP
jgi:hypothetical protein